MSVPSEFVQVKSPRCANQSNEPGGQKCSNDFVPGHIYCDPCRVANGGYNRYTRPRS